MWMKKILSGAFVLGVLGLANGADPSLKSGPVALKSAGALAFGPDNVVFVADAAAKTLYAIDTQDKAAKNTFTKIEKVDEQIAAGLGITADQLVINDVKVNPATGRIFLSATRGKGPQAAAVLVKLNDDGKASEVDLKNVPHSSVKLAEGDDKKATVVTSLAFVKSNVIVSGLSNQEWESNLKSIPFPFSAANPGAGVQIFHGAHGKYETKSPIQTFAAYEIAGQTHLLASYVCTPLVKIPLDSIKAGEKVKGKTVAELGNRNRPLDIVTYTKDGKDYALLANSARGVMKVALENIDKAEEITSKVNGEVAGLKYESIKTLDGTVQLDKISTTKAVVLRKVSGATSLEVIDLP